MYTVPRELDDEVARLKLESMGIAIDSLTDEQRGTCRHGTRAPSTLAAVGALSPGGDRQAGRIRARTARSAPPARRAGRAALPPLAGRDRGDPDDGRPRCAGHRHRRGVRDRAGGAAVADAGVAGSASRRCRARLRRPCRCPADGRQPGLGRQPDADSRRSAVRGRRRSPRGAGRSGGRAAPGGGRTLRADRRARRRAAEDGRPGAHPLQRRRAGDRRLRHRAGRHPLGASARPATCTCGWTRRARCCRAPG